MGRLFIITIAYARSAQFARCLMEYKKTAQLKPYKHIICQAYFPIDTERNNHEIKLITESYGEAELWDPGKNLGSAESQTWVLNQLDIQPDDFWINLDNDSICRTPGWDAAMEVVLANDPNCITVSCNAPMVEFFKRERNQQFREKDVYGVRTGILECPTPFNLSAFRCSFIKEIGGVPQMFPYWGELEGPLHYQATMRGKYHSYLLDYMEDESSKYFHPHSNLEWKDLHARTTGPEQFIGSYDEFLRYKYPHLAELRI